MEVNGGTTLFGAWKFFKINGRPWRFFTKIPEVEFPIVRRGPPCAFLHQLVGHLSVRNEPAANAQVNAPVKQELVREVRRAPLQRKRT